MPAKLPNKPLIAVDESAIRLRPLWPVEAAALYLGTDAKGIDQRLQDGRIAVAFNVSASPGRRRELRVLALSVLECKGSLITAKTRTANLTHEQLVSIILQHGRESLSGTELQRIFSVSADLIADLRRKGELAIVNEPLAKRGQNASPRFTRASVTEFLRRRRLA